MPERLPVGFGRRDAPRDADSSESGSGFANADPISSG